MAIAISSQVLEREIKRETDLALFDPADLDRARTQWLLRLNEHMQQLDQARGDVRNEFDYGGAAAVCDAHADLENKVDEARRMVCVLSSEMRRRSEGQVEVWKEETPPLHTIVLGGMIKANSCQ